MVYIFESNLPENKSVSFALSQIYGLGITRGNFIVKAMGFSSNLKIKDLSKEDVNKLVRFIESLGIPLASDLKKLKLIENKQLVAIKLGRGLRKAQGLPVRGQRTHTNAKTARKRF